MKQEPLQHDFRVIAAVGMMTLIVVVPLACQSCGSHKNRQPLLPPGATMTSRSLMSPHSIPHAAATHSLPRTSRDDDISSVATALQSFPDGPLNSIPAKTSETDGEAECAAECHSQESSVKVAKIQGQSLINPSSPTNSSKSSPRRALHVETSSLTPIGRFGPHLDEFQSNLEEPESGDVDPTPRPPSPEGLAVPDRFRFAHDKFQTLSAAANLPGRLSKPLVPAASAEKVDS